MSMTKEQTKAEQRIDLTADNPLATVNRTAMARELGVSLSYVSRALAQPSKRQIRLGMARRIATYLGITIDQLHELVSNIPQQ